jgi:hypothetical protein
MLINAGAKLKSKQVLDACMYRKCYLMSLPIDASLPPEDYKKFPVV